jgi:hypothetical protein
MHSFPPHHFVKTGIASRFSVYFVQEFPTVMLQGKRYFDIRNNAFETVFGILFLLLRIVYYLGVSYMMRDIIFADYWFTFSFVMVRVEMCGHEWIHPRSNPLAPTPRHA